MGSSLAASVLIPRLVSPQRNPDWRINLNYALTYKNWFQLLHSLPRAHSNSRSIGAAGYLCPQLALHYDSQ